MTVSVRHPVVPFTVDRPFPEPAVAAAAAEFAATGFCQTDPVPVGADLLPYAREVYGVLVEHGQRIEVRHRLEHTYLTGGGRFRRLDPGRPDLTAPVRAALERTCADLGAAGFFEALRRALAPLTDAVLPDYGYERGFYLGYGPGDYLSVHDDRTTGDRVNVQMPVTAGGTGALRVLGPAGFLEPHLDLLGAVRVLGPEVWHDVPPLLTSDDAAFRVVLSLRFRRRRA